MKIIDVQTLETGNPFEIGKSYQLVSSQTLIAPNGCKITNIQMAEVSAPKPTNTPEHIMQFFAYSHLPERLQAVSKPFGLLADQIINSTPASPERTVALRKLLESKDAAVRAFMAN
jgi:hypothetical protein